MAGDNKVDSKTKQERVHEISLMLRRKSTPYILQYIAEKWGLQEREAYYYIEEAKEEWEKYFSQVKKCGKAYYVSQLRDLKDQAYSRAVVIGRGENKVVVEIPDLNLIFEITKEEAKLMGIYPVNKEELDLTIHKGLDYAEYKNFKGMTKDERAAFIAELSEIVRVEGNGDAGKGKSSNQEESVVISKDNIPKL